MQNVLKPFGGKDIGLLSGRFRTARAQLTLTYVLVLAAVLALSSAVIYTAFSSRLDQRFRGLPPRLIPRVTEIELRQQDVLADFTSSLFLVNGALLVLLGMFSYWFAGITLRPIQIAYNRQRRFLGDASHELRTPLAILRTDFENELGSPKLTEEQREQVASHLEEVERMGHIVGDLLLLSRLDERKETQERYAYVNLSATIQRAVTRLQSVAERHQVTLTLIPSAVTIEALGEEKLFSQVIENVIKNAIIYNKAGGSVTITPVLEKDYVRVIIQDTGIGIDEADLERIFDRFYRADASRSRQTGGSGLGLSIVQSVMHRLDGAVHVTSKIGEGTNVILEFRHARASSFLHES